MKEGTEKRLRFVRLKEINFWRVALAVRLHLFVFPAECLLVFLTEFLKIEALLLENRENKAMSKKIAKI